MSVRAGGCAVQVRVRLGAQLAGANGPSQVSVEVPEQATVGDLLARLAEAYPGLAPALATAVVAVGGRVVPPEHPVDGGGEVALLRPVAGG